MSGSVRADVICGLHSDFATLFVSIRGVSFHLLAKDFVKLGRNKIR
jgi:hypothetical protein